MHVNGMMTSQLLIVKNWIDGKDIQAQLSGHAVCVYSIVPTILNKDCNIAIPCKGDRRLAAAQDDEIVFTMVPEMLPNFIEGIHWLQQHNWGIPIIQEYKEEYDLKPKYRDLLDKLGMDSKNRLHESRKFKNIDLDFLRRLVNKQQKNFVSLRNLVRELNPSSTRCPKSYFLFLRSRMMSAASFAATPHTSGQPFLP